MNEVINLNKKKLYEFVTSMLSKIKLDRSVSLFFPNILVPMIVLILYFYSIEILLNIILKLPNGVNYFFLHRSRNYLLIITMVSTFVFGTLLLINRAKNNKNIKNIDQLLGGDKIILLVPLTPIFQYIINNQDILSPFDALYIIFVFLIISIIYIFIIPSFFAFLGSTRILQYLGLAFILTFNSMALLSHTFLWFREGSLKIQWIFMVVTFLVSWILSNLQEKNIFRLIIVLFFVINTITQMFSQKIEPSKISLPFDDNELMSYIQGMKNPPLMKPNIYFLVFDAYVSSETMLSYGIDNKAQENYLDSNGFKLYPNTYSVGASTLETMNIVFNVSLDQNGSGRKGVSGDGVVQEILKYIGYETYGLFPYDYMFRGVGSSYDYTYPRLSYSSNNRLLSAILVGEFKFNIGYEEVNYDNFITTKQQIFGENYENPVFVYAQTFLPGHSQNSGKCQINETDLFQTRLSSANIEMRNDIDTIIKNDPEAIIIIAGDHGPYLTKNCTSTKKFFDISEISRIDIQDRHGTFLAIRWPQDGFVKYDDIIILQDLFLAILSNIYDNESFLDFKIESTTISSNSISGAFVENGKISGGINDGEYLFLSGE